MFAYIYDVVMNICGNVFIYICKIFMSIMIYTHTVLDLYAQNVYNKCVYMNTCLAYTWSEINMCILI